MHTSYNFKATLTKGSRIRIAMGTAKKKGGGPVTLDDAIVAVTAILKDECNQGFDSLRLSIRPKRSKSQS